MGEEIKGDSQNRGDYVFLLGKSFVQVFALLLIYEAFS